MILDEKKEIKSIDQCEKALVDLGFNQKEIQELNVIIKIVIEQIFNETFIQNYGE